MNHTARIQALIDKGGAVTVPAENHPFRPLRLGSGATLVLEEGARILAVCDTNAQLPVAFLVDLSVLTAY